MLEINLNDNCEVVLLERGVQAIKDYNDKYGFTGKKWEIKAGKAGDVYKGQLWHLMEVFGPAISLSKEPPLETEMKIKC